MGTHLSQVAVASSLHEALWPVWGPYEAGITVGTAPGIVLWRLADPVGDIQKMPTWLSLSVLHCSGACLQAEFMMLLINSEVQPQYAGCPCTLVVSHPAAWEVHILSLSAQGSCLC